MNSKTEPGQPCISSSGHGFGPLPGHVQEMHVDVVQRRLELRERVQPRLLGAPVETAAPVLDQAAQVIDVRAVFPGLAGRLIGESRARETFAQIGNRRVRDVQAEGCRLRAHPAILHVCRDLMPRTAFWQPGRPTHVAAG